MTEQFDMCLPTKRSEYHSEIHGGEDRILISQSQCKYLAKRARVCGLDKFIFNSQRRYSYVWTYS